MYTKISVFAAVVLGFAVTLSGCALFPQRDFVVPATRPTPVVRTPIGTPPPIVEEITEENGEDPAIVSPSAFSYSFEFPLNFSVVTNTYYSEKFTSEHLSAQFPRSSVLGISEATIDLGVGDEWCRPDLFSNGTVVSTSTRSISGLTFQKVSLVDSAAGTQYRTTVYFAKQENKCYAIVMFSHTTSPENFADSVEESVKLRQKFDTELEKINTIFDRVAGTFRFREIK